MNGKTGIILVIILIIIVIIGLFYFFMPIQNSSSLYTLPQNNSASSTGNNLGSSSSTTGTNSSGGLTDTTTSNNSPNSAGSTDSTGGNSGSAGAQQSSGGTSSNPFNDLKNLVSGSPEYMVTYNFSGAGATYQMTEYFKSGKIRTDASSNGYSSETFVLPDGIYSCTQISGTWTCYKAQQSAPNTTTPSSSTDLRSHINDYTNNVTALPGMTILGQSTTCYQITAASFTSSYCYNSKGVPLYMKTTSAQTTTELTATSYSDTVADSVFNLPATAQDLGSAASPYQVPAGYK